MGRSWQAAAFARRSRFVRAAVIAATMASGLALAVADAGQKPQVALGEFRYEDKPLKLAHAIAWQEKKEGHWVTIVLVTEQPVPRESITEGSTAFSLMTGGGLQGVSIAVMSGGVPLAPMTWEVGTKGELGISVANVTGVGGIEIESQSATQIKGRLLANPVTYGSRDKDAWLIAFDAPVIRGDAKQMAAEGEPLGPTGGQPGRDLLAFQQAMLAMDFAAISAYASPEMSKFLADPAARAKELTMLKNMTPPQSKIFGGLQKGNHARIYWVKQFPKSLHMRCIDELELIDGKWRSTTSTCEAA